MFSLPIHLLIATIVGFLSAHLAARRGRNSFLWFGIGFLFGILGILAIFLIPSAKKKQNSEAKTLKAIPQLYIDGPNDRFWYYLDSTQQQQGPMSHNALTQAWKKGEIASTTLVWHEELPDWKELQELIKNKLEYTP
jgi:hypothetical protein